MSLNKVVGIFGYNNTRIYDVVKISKIVKERHGADIVLVKQGIDENDRQVTPYCFDHLPEDPAIAETLPRFLEEHGLTLIGCLPFSDKGVIGAAHVAKRFGLFGDDCDTAPAMLDKNRFRLLEQNILLPEASYKKPVFARVHNTAELRQHFNAFGPFFIKPLAEGNSRGCMKIETNADLDCWLQDYAGNLAQGAICEEILSQDNEYSFDGVAGTYWITQKFTTSGAFRAEYQHIIPAPLEAATTRHIHGLLEPLLHSLGSRGGAFHHEFFRLADGRIASVEPNRRPAGMWLWDIAGWAFEDFDPWTRWIDRCVGQATPAESLQQKTFAGVRGVIAKQDGVIQSLDEEALTRDLHAAFGATDVRFSLLKRVGSMVRAEPRDNSDFLAFVALRHPIYNVLLEELAVADEIIRRHIQLS